MHLSLSIIFAAAFAFAICTAHSNLGQPLPYNKVACKASEKWCKGACPPIWRTGGSRARNTPQNPPATWKRGQRVEIIWHKNNHIGGFYRRSLVPVKHMFSHKWHGLTAFDFGCWGQGTFQCGKNDVCGGDKRGRAYKNTVVIPDVFPDGIYVFGQVWYGGLHWRKTAPKYSDYFACSYVRIKGGNPLKTEATATWTGSKGKCATGSTRTMQCGGEACERNPVIIAVPDEFRNGKKPKLYLKTLDTEMKFTNVKATNNDGQKEVMQEMKKMEAADVQAGIEEETQSAHVSAAKKISPSSTSAMKSINVYLGSKFTKAVYDGEDVVIDTEGKDVKIEVYTAGKNVGRITMLVDGKIRWREARTPYVFQGNIGKNWRKWNKPILNKKFAFSAFFYRRGKKISISVALTLAKQ